MNARLRGWLAAAQQYTAGSLPYACFGPVSRACRRLDLWLRLHSREPQ